MNEGWRTKKDVIKDLKFATGSYNHEINEEDVIRGEQPPPRLTAPYEDVDDEILRLCGGLSTDVASATAESCLPDFTGITNMIRMVQQYNENPNLSPDDTQNIAEEDSLLSISKLNPNVPPYVPKGVNSVDVVLNENKKPNQNSTASTAATTNVTSERNQLNIANNVNTVKETNKADNISTNSHRVDVSKLTDSEVKDMKEKLKQKIENTSNEKCVKIKRERNLAMATLVKLHCASETNDLKTPKLLAPEYFEKSISEQKTFVTDSQKPLHVSRQGATPNKLDNTTDSSIGNKGCEPLVDNDTVKPRVLGNNTTEYNVTPSSTCLIDRNIQNQKPSTSAISLKDSSKSEEANKVNESIEKVENWLNSPQKVSKAPKAPTLYLGPVTFKRKAKSSSSKTMSPISTVSENTSNTVDPVEAFVPTEYANRLNMQYEARRKPQPNVEGNIWTKLESQLKEKDEQIKKLMQNSSSSLSTL